MSTNYFKRFVNWIENGDMVPLVIAVSVPHYAHVLAQFEFMPVAAVIGFLVDVGHYRTIKLYLNTGAAGWMIVLTLFSAGFHMAFYAIGGAGLAAVLLGAAPVAVIFSLAYITRKEKLDVKAGRDVGHVTVQATGHAKRTSLPAGTVQEASNDGSLNTNQDKLQAGRAAKKAAKVDMMLDVFRTDPHAEYSAVAKQLNMSRTTLYNYIGELEQQGRVHVNGNGVEILK